MLEKLKTLRVDKVVYCFILVLAFIFPLSKKVIPSLLIAIIVSSIFLFNYKKKEFKSLLKPIWFNIFQWGFYLIYVIGLLKSPTSYSGFFDLQVKFSFLIIPWLYITFFKVMNLKKLFNILNSFVLGNLLASILCFIFIYKVDHNYDSAVVYFKSDFSLFHHPSYASMYAIFTLLITYYHYYIKKSNKIPFNTAEKTLYISSIVILPPMIFFLDSKMGLLSFSAIILLVFIHALVSKFISIKYLVATLSVFFISLIGISQFKQLRIQKFVENLSMEKIKKNERYKTWNSSIEIIKKNPVTGVGTGNVKNALINNYKKNNKKALLKKKMNAHNQYLQTTIALGIGGGIWLLAMLIIPLIYALKNKNILYAGFLILFMMNLLVESMLEKQAGVTFFAIFNVILFLYMRRGEG